MTDELADASIESLQERMQAGTLTAVALTEYYLDRIERFNPELNAVQTTNPDALEEAAALDEERRARGARSLLHGVPVIVKDNYETAGMPTTAGSVLFAGFDPGRDVLVTRRAGDVVPPIGRGQLVRGDSCRLAVEVGRIVEPHPVGEGDVAAPQGVGGLDHRLGLTPAGHDPDP